MKMLSRISILAAVVMLTLHNLAPHEHQGQFFFSGSTEGLPADPRDEAPGERDLWTWLSDIFEADLGDGHLECFSRTETVNPDWHQSFEVPAYIIPSGISIELRQAAGPTIIIAYHPVPAVSADDLSAGITLRGPPHSA